VSGLKSFVRQRVWAREGIDGKLAWMALWPLSVLFGVAIRLRSGAYAIGIFRAAKAALPVVSVGNLSVGGAGKTPFSLWLAGELQRRGRHPAIVLRGYGGSARQATVVASEGSVLTTVEAVGDEAIMLGRRFSGVVVAARRRSEGAAVAQAQGCDVVVLDDGFQHRRLARDCDIVLVTSSRASLLPAGPLREPRSALRRADAVVRVRKGGEGPGDLGVVAAPVFEATFAATALVESVQGEWQERPLGLLAGRRVATVSGIADPGPFHDMVRQWEAEIVEMIALEDHHNYTVEDWRRIANQTRQVDLVLTTEKDLVKLEVFPFARKKLLALRIAPAVEGGTELVDLVCARIERAGQGGEHGDKSRTA